MYIYIHIYIYIYIYIYKSLSCSILHNTTTLCTQLKVYIKGLLLGLRQFLVTESPLKVMKNAFCFTLKIVLVLKIFKFLS